MINEQSQDIVAFLARQVAAMSPNDSVGRAAELLRNGAFPVIPVMEQGYLVGMVSDRELRVALNGGITNGALDRPVSDIMEREFKTLLLNEPHQRAYECLKETTLPAIGITDAIGRYIGIVSVSDLMSRSSAPVRPAQIGGMATPLGVYLTTGFARAGARGLGLALTGFLLMTLFAISDFIVYLTAWSVQHYTPFPLLVWSRSPYLGANTVADIVGPMLNVIIMPIFLLLMKSLPLAGTHGAEHKVVHAIERGERLTLDVVKRMPRVHPRCGTNLAAGAMLFIGLSQIGATHSIGEIGLLLALMLTIFLWRPVGNLVQLIFTTKEPTDKQLEGAIEAGKELLTNYQRTGMRYTTLVQRLISSGLPQVLIGWGACWAIVFSIYTLLHINFPLISQ